jgi:hypothetical protein
LDNSAARPRCVVFLHIPKTGGQTLYAILARKYDPSRTVTILDRADPLTPFRNASRKGTPVLIRGHFPFGIDQRLGVEPAYITILRHPVDRVVSIYRYIERYEGHPLHAQVRSAGMTLADFIKSDIDQEEVDNGQTRLLAGDLGEVDAQALERAKTNLRTFAAIALTERFDEGLTLFRRRLGWSSPPFYVSKNVSPRDGGPVTVPEETRNLLKERNRVDMELYRYAAQVFERQTRSARWFKAEVGAFRKLNGLAQLYKRLA